MDYQTHRDGKSTSMGNAAKDGKSSVYYQTQQTYRRGNGKSAMDVQNMLEFKDALSSDNNVRR